MARYYCFFLVVALSVCCCSDDSPGDNFCQSTIEVIFDPDGDVMLPFPSNYFLEKDSATITGYRVNITEDNIPPGETMFEAYTFMQDDLNALDGFGTSAEILFGFSAEIGSREMIGGEMVVTPPESLQISSAETVEANSPAVLICIDADSPDYRKPVPRILEYLSERAEDRSQHTLIIETAFPLRPKTAYALALTTRLTDRTDHCLAPSEPTQRLLSGKHPQEFGLLGEQAPLAVDILAEEGFIQDKSEVSGLTVFTTQSIEEEILAAANAILQNPPSIVANSLQITQETDGIAAKVEGRFTATQYRNSDGNFVIQDGKPVPQETAELEFELLIPEETAEHRPPFPVVIYQHGLTGKKEEDKGAKRAQAKAGFASLAIDAVEHGSRGDPEDGLGNLFRFFTINAEGNFDMPVLRDNFRQTFLDIVSLAELVPVLAGMDLLPDGNPDGVLELQAEPVYLSGHSLGAVISAGALALSPRIPLGNLCAGGGRLTTNLFMRSEVFSIFIDALKPEGTTTTDIRRFMPLLQLVIEKGDPVNLARLVVTEPPEEISGSAPKHVLYQEVIDDGFVPNRSNETLGRALGQDHLQPVVREVFGLAPVSEPASANHLQGVTAVFFQFDQLANGDPAGHTDIYSDTTAQTQWIHFFETHRDSGTPEAADPYRILGIDR
jgi:hypothetical protein